MKWRRELFLETTEEAPGVACSEKKLGMLSDWKRELFRPNDDDYRHGSFSLLFLV